mmetsp:Transcript_51574/g.95070  ORF Transcript_51574/g.95070 Transcript_51574/m.95070 type:complete len:516 (-) Transcript_51574:98-1645(-)
MTQHTSLAARAAHQQLGKTRTYMACFPPCGCLPFPARSKQRRCTREECSEGQQSASSTATGVSSEEWILDTNFLDVGFLECQLKGRRGWPKYEVYIKFQSADTTEEGIGKLLEFLDVILNLDLVAEGFELTYDLRKLYVPPVEIISEILRWSAEIKRQEKWGQRCKGWKVIVPAGAYFEMARRALTFMFYFNPPRCRTELVSDAVGGRYVSFGPDLQTNFDTNGGQDMLSDAFSAISDSLQQSLQVFNYDDLPSSWNLDDILGPPPSDSQVSGDPPARTSAADSSKECDGSGNLAHSEINVGFAIVSQGFDKGKQMGYLRITGSDSEFNEEGVVNMLQFMDDFTNSSNAETGFSMTYDLRHLRAPSMSMIKRVAEWGNDPCRQKTWQRLNKCCKVVISPGLRFTALKGILNSFFYVCPPVTRTFLLTDPDEPEENAIVFDPPAMTDKEQLSNAGSESTESHGRCTSDIESTETGGRSSADSSDFADNLQDAGVSHTAMDKVDEDFHTWRNWSEDV